MKPEDRILNALIEGLEAAGKAWTPKEVARMRNIFTLGYCSGSLIRDAQETENMARQNINVDGLLTVEETIEQMIRYINTTTLERLIK